MDESRRMRDLVSAPHGGVHSCYDYDHRTGKRNVGVVHAMDIAQSETGMRKS